jgi:uncharacterized protein
VTAVSPRTAVRRHPEPCVYEHEALDAILDEAVTFHVVFLVDGQPFVIPTVHARVGGLLYLHGSAASRMLRTLGKGVDICVTATLLDGVVLARSVYKSSLNYRSVVVGRANKLEDEIEQRFALEAVVEHVAPGRPLDARPPSDEELKATTVLSLPIHSASAKIRSAPPEDFERDLDLPLSAGAIPVALTAETPLTADRVPRGVPIFRYANYKRPVLQ